VIFCFTGIYRGTSNCKSSQVQVPASTATRNGNSDNLKLYRAAIGVEEEDIFV